MPSTKALMACARWLIACRSFGWPASSIKFLDELWWKYHDDHGNLKSNS